MSAQIRRLQRRAAYGCAAVMLTFVAMVVSFLAAWRDAVWIVDPVALAALVYTLRAVPALNGARERQQCEAKEREQRHRALRRIAAPDARDGQCPVCGFDDLDELAERDRFLDEPDGSAYRRVTTYGARRAHQECAELVPHTPTTAETHRLGGHAYGPAFGCALCHAQTNLGASLVLPTVGMSITELGEGIAAAFGVPPAQVAPRDSAAAATRPPSAYLTVPPAAGDAWAHRLGFTDELTLLQTATRSGLLSPNEVRQLRHDEWLRLRDDLEARLRAAISAGRGQ